MARWTISGAESYHQGKPCPKCGHVRAAADAAPQWRCPGCGNAYPEFEEAQPKPGAPAPGLVAGAPGPAWMGIPDHSFLALIAANLLAIAAAVGFQMPLRALMFVYWFQSVVIGISFVLRMILARDYSLDPTVEAVPEAMKLFHATGGKYFKIIFFFVHYGFFHLIYLIFITMDSKMQRVPLGLGWQEVLVCAVFAANHAYSLACNIRADRAGRPRLDVLFWLPYARIVPMHVTIIFAPHLTAAFAVTVERLRETDPQLLLGGRITGAAAALVLLLGLKTLADVVMHVVEHRALRGSAPRI